MPDKDFETKIRSSLEELNLEPSAQVWDAVSGRISSRRRRWIFYWLPLMILVGGMAWWRFGGGESSLRGGSSLRGDSSLRGASSLQGTKNDRDSIAMENEPGAPRKDAGAPRSDAGAGQKSGGAAQKSTGVGQKSDGATQKSTGAGQKRLTGGALAGSGSRQGGMNEEGQGTGSNQGGTRAAEQAAGGEATPRIESGAGTGSGARTGNGTGTGNGLGPGNGADGAVPASGMVAPGAPASVSAPGAPAGISAPGVSVSAFAPELSYSPSQLLDLFAFPPAETPPGPVVRLPTAQSTDTPPKDATSRWQTRAYVGGGISGQSHLLKYHVPTGSGVGVNLPYSYTASSPTNNNVGTGSGPTYITASRDPGLGVEAGVEEQYRLARHWKVQAGLDYAHWQTVFGNLGQATTAYSTGASTGNSASGGTAIPGVYWGGYGKINYVNRYSLFQLPVGVSWLMAPSRRLNPALFADVSVGYLTGSHIMQYEADSLVYHTGSPDLLKHWSGYGRLGFTIDVGHWSHGLLYLGPVMEYGLWGLQKRSAVQDHLNYAGFRVGFGFR